MNGCSSTCAIETRWVCNNIVNATSTCTYTKCGNSYIDSGETCDDGNTVSGDGCSSTCQAEACYWCSGAGPTSCTKTCENGAFNSGYPNGKYYYEYCDEGAGSDDLGCLDCCTRIQTGYKCSYGQECWLRCGDGVRDSGSDSWDNAGEACDDGNRVSGDGCKEDCALIEDHYECIGGTSCRKICGNGNQDSPFNHYWYQGNHFSEECDYSKSGNNLQNTFKDPHSVCCTDCKYDYSRSIRKQLGLEFSYNDEQTFFYQSGTYKARNVAGTYGSTQIEYCVPVCKSSYTTGKEFNDSWLSAYNSNYPVYYDKLRTGTRSGYIDLTKYNKIVSNYYIDPSTRVCFQGKYCYDCLLPKFPGYAVSTAPDTDTTIIKSSRGKLRLIEYSETAYGFSYVTNQKSQIQFSSSLASVTLSHVTQGNTRQSWGNFYIQSNGISLHDIYALHDIGGTLKFEKLYSTTESVKVHLGYDRAIWWPTKNFFLVRQYDQLTWDGYGLNSLSVQVSKAPTSYLPDQQFEPFSTGPILIDGDLPFDAVFANDMMFLYRENTKNGNKYVTIYSWTPGHFRVEYETQVTNSNAATSFVSFGQNNGALLWWNTQKTGILYKPDGTTATITVSITDSTKSTLWGSTASPDFRLIQARPSPLNSNQAPAVYGYFEKNVLFTVTLSGTNIVLNPVVTLDTRFNLYQPIDIGQTYLANMVVHPCTMPTTNTDIYNDASVMFYKLGSASTLQCITLDTTDSPFN